MLQETFRQVEEYVTLTLLLSSGLCGAVLVGVGGCLESRGADEDLPPISAVSGPGLGLGESWREAEGEGRASEEVPGL